MVCLPPHSCMLLTSCCVPVETVNETVAALYNITDFSRGECCCSAPSVWTQPFFLLTPRPTRVQRAPFAWPQPGHLLHCRPQLSIISSHLWKTSKLPLERQYEAFKSKQSSECIFNDGTTKKYWISLGSFACEPGGGCF